VTQKSVENDLRSISTRLAAKGKEPPTRIFRNGTTEKERVVYLPNQGKEKALRVRKKTGTRASRGTKVVYLKRKESLAKVKMQTLFKKPRKVGERRKGGRLRAPGGIRQKVDPEMGGIADVLQTQDVRKMGSTEGGGNDAGFPQQRSYSKGRPLGENPTDEKGFRI